MLKIIPLISIRYSHNSFKIGVVAFLFAKGHKKDTKE